MSERSADYRFSSEDPADTADAEPEPKLEGGGERDNRRRRAAGPRAKPVTPERLERVALWYLERFAASSDSLRRVLMRRVHRAVAELGEDAAAGAALVEVLIRRYAESGLIDDRRFAAGRTASLHRRGASRLAIARTLAAKGIDGEIIAEATAAERPGGELAAAASLARRRRLGPYRPPELRGAKAEKDLATLARAGFSLQIARLVLNAEDLEELETLLAER